MTVTLTPADSGGSGVAATQYRLQGSSTWLAAAGNAFVVPAPADGSGDGAQHYQYQALDGAGNASATGTCTVKIDTQGPVVTPTNLQGDDLSGWSTTSQTVTLTPSDAGAGVATTYYTIDGGSQQTYTSPFTVSGTGQHPVVYWATDVLGNVTAQHTGWVNISNPYAQATNLQGDNHSGWRNTAATVTITGGGDHSPFRIYYKVDSGSWQNVASPASFSVSGQGNHTVAYYADEQPRRSKLHRDRLRQHRHHGAGHDGHRPAGKRQHRLADDRPGCDAERHRRHVRRSRHQLHDRRRSVADVHGSAVRGFRQRLPRRDLSLGRRRRQHRDDAHRLREHRHRRPDHDAQRGSRPTTARAGRRTPRPP